MAETFKFSAHIEAAGYSLVKQKRLAQKLNYEFESQSVDTAVAHLRTNIEDRKLDSDEFVFEDSDPFIYLVCPALRFKKEIELHSSNNKKFAYKG